MLKIDRAYKIALCFLAALYFFPLALPHSFKIDETVSPLFFKFPVQVGNWLGKNEALDQRTYEILETKNILSRTYENGQGDKIHLLLVGSEQDRRVAHPPEVCYLGSHYTILEKQERRITLNPQTSLNIREFLAKSNQGEAASQNVMYVYKVGNRFTANYYDQQIQFAWDRLTRKNSEVLLIRIAGQNKEVFAEFLNDLIGVLNVSSPTG